MDSRPAHKRFPSGRFVDVFWPLDELWYRALVVQSVPLRRTQVMLYDDGDVEELNLAQQQAEGLVRKRPKISQVEAGKNLVKVVEKDEKWRICGRCDSNLETVQFPCPCEEPICLDSSDEDEERGQTLVWGGQVLQAKGPLARLRRQCPGCFLSGGVPIGASVCPNCKLQLMPAKSKRGRNLLLTGASSSTSGLTTEPALECTPSMGRSKLLEAPEASNEDCKPVIASRTPDFRRLSPRGKKRVLAKAESSLPETPQKASASMTSLTVRLLRAEEILNASPASFVSALQDSLASEGSAEKSTLRRAALSNSAENESRMEGPAAKMVDQCAEGASAAKPLTHKRREVERGGPFKTEPHALVDTKPCVETAHKTPESKLVRLRDSEDPFRLHGRIAPWAILSNRTAKKEEADCEKKPAKCVGMKERMEAKETSRQKSSSLAVCKESKEPTESTTQPTRTPKQELTTELGVFLRERILRLSATLRPAEESLLEVCAEGGGEKCVQQEKVTALESPAGVNETICEQEVRRTGPEETDCTEAATDNSGMEDDMGLGKEKSRPEVSAFAVAGASLQKAANDAERAAVGHEKLVSEVQAVRSESEADRHGTGLESRETEHEPSSLKGDESVPLEEGQASEAPVEAEGTLKPALGANKVTGNRHVEASHDLFVDDISLDLEAALGDVERLIAEHDKVSADLVFLTPPKASPKRTPPSRSSLNKPVGPFRLRRKRSFAPRKARGSPQTPARTPVFDENSEKLLSPQWQDGKKAGLKGPDGSLCKGRIKKMPDIYSSPRSFEFRLDEEIRLREQDATSSKTKRKKKDAAEGKQRENGVGNPKSEGKKVKQEEEKARSMIEKRDAERRRGEESQKPEKRGRSSDESDASGEDKASPLQVDTGSWRKRGQKSLDDGSSQEETCAAAKSNGKLAAGTGLPLLDWADMSCCDEGFECTMEKFFRKEGERLIESATANEQSGQEEGTDEKGQTVSRECPRDLAGSTEQVESREEKRDALGKQDAAIQTASTASKKRKQRQLRSGANLVVPTGSAEKRGVEVNEEGNKRQKGESSLLEAGSVESRECEEENERTKEEGREREQKEVVLMHGGADSRAPEKPQLLMEPPAVTSAISQPATQGVDTTAEPLLTTEAEILAEQSDAGTAVCDKVGSPVSGLEEERHFSADPDVLGFMPVEMESLETRSEPSFAETLKQEVGVQVKISEPAKVDDTDWEEAFLSLDPLSPPLPRGCKSSLPNLVLDESWPKADTEDALASPEGVLELPKLVIEESLQPVGGAALETSPRSPPETSLQWPYSPFEQQESALTTHPEATPQSSQDAPVLAKLDPPQEGLLPSSVQENEQPGPAFKPAPFSPTHAQIAREGTQSPRSPEVTQQSHVTSPDLGQRTPPRNPRATIDPDFGAPSELKRKRRWPSLSPAAKKRLATMASPLSEDDLKLADGCSPKESPYFGRKKRTERPFSERESFRRKEQGGADATSLQEAVDKMPPPEKKRLKFSLLFDEEPPANVGASDRQSNLVRPGEKAGHVTQPEESLFQSLRAQGLGSTADRNELLDKSRSNDDADRGTAQRNDCKEARTESGKVDFDEYLAHLSEASSYADEQPAVDSRAGGQEMTTEGVLSMQDSGKVLGDSARGVERLQANLSKTLEAIGAVPKRVDSNAKDESGQAPPLRLRLPSGGPTRVLPGLRDDRCDSEEKPLASDAAQNTTPFEGENITRVNSRLGHRVKLSRSLRLLQAAKDIASERAAAEKRALVAPLTSSLTGPSKSGKRNGFEWSNDNSPPAYGGISARGRFIGGRDKLIRQRPMSVDELTRENTVRNTGCRIRMPRLAPGARKKKRRRTMMRSWSDVSEAIEGAADNSATSLPSGGESSSSSAERQGNPSVEESPEPVEPPAAIDTSPDFSLATPRSVNLESLLPDLTPSPLLPDLSPEVADQEESNGAARSEGSGVDLHLENESPQRHDLAGKESPVLKGPAGFGSPLRSSRGSLRSTSPRGVLGFSGGPLKGSRISWDLAGAVARGKESLEPLGGWLPTPLKSILKKQFSRSRQSACGHPWRETTDRDCLVAPSDSLPASAAPIEVPTASVDQPSEAGEGLLASRKRKGVRFSDENGQGQLVKVRLFERN